MFCPECGAILVPTKIENKLKLRCPKCGIREEEIKDTKDYRVIKKRKEQKKHTIIIKDTILDSGAEPVEGHCEKCGHNRIINWNHYSTQGENEIVLLFHRCVKCGNTWREVGN